MDLNEDRTQLILFISNVYVWLEACYVGHEKRNDNRWPTLRIYKSLQPLGKEAWVEFKSDHPLDEIREQINELSEKKLKAHGLYGKQLKFKLSVIDLLAEKLRNLSSKYRFRPKLVDAIDVLLDSLIGAFGGGTALKELKDILRAQIH
jgi:hypothetical protein